jgi:hypothetical protein
MIDAEGGERGKKAVQFSNSCFVLESPIIYMGMGGIKVGLSTAKMGMSSPP